MAKGKTTKPVMEQAHGKIENSPKRSLDEILGTGKRRYHQTNLDEYKAHLKTLNLTDMQVHAQQLGIIPISDRRLLETRLTKEFQKTASKYFGTAITEHPKEISERARRILASGR